MLAHVNFYDLLFIDIETVPEQPSFNKLSDTKQQLWGIKHNALRIEGEAPDSSYLKRSGVFAEFAKIICITIGYLHFEKATGKRVLRLKTFAGDDEHKLLSDFAGLITTNFDQTGRYHFCGHNIKEFDVPFVCRRLLINRIALPEMLDRSGKRPWQNEDIDTMHLWRFGDYKHFTSLKLLVEVLGVPSPKEDIEGKDVCRVYWQEGGLKRIVEYCQRDVVTVARLILRFKGEAETIEDEQVVIAN